MGTVWIAVVYAVLRHPIEFLRGLFAAWRTGSRSQRTKNQNRDALAAWWGITREELDEIFKEMRNER